MRAGRGGAKGEKEGKGEGGVDGADGDDRSSSDDEEKLKAKTSKKARSLSTSIPIALPPPRLYARGVETVKHVLTHAPVPLRDSEMPSKLHWTGRRRRRDWILPRRHLAGRMSAELVLAKCSSSTAAERTDAL